MSERIEGEGRTAFESLRGGRRMPFIGSSRPELELEAEVRRGGVRGRLVFMLVSLSESIDGPGSKGVALPESLSVDILSRSLSESSPVPFELWRRVKDVTRGLWRRASAEWESPPGRGARRLGRRSRNMNGLRSSEEDGARVVDGEEGRAKSDVDVGRDGRVVMDIGPCLG